MIFDLFLFPTPCPGCVISQDHAIKGSYFMGNRSPSKYVTILPSLVAIGTLVVGIKWVWFVTWSRKTMRSKSRVVEGEDSALSRLNPPLLSISHGLKVHSILC